MNLHLHNECRRRCTFNLGDVYCRQHPLKWCEGEHCVSPAVSGCFKRPLPCKGKRSARLDTIACGGCNSPNHWIGCGPGCTAKWCYHDSITIIESDKVTKAIRNDETSIQPAWSHLQAGQWYLNLPWGVRWIWMFRRFTSANGLTITDWKMLDRLHELCGVIFCDFVINHCQLASCWGLSMVERQRSVPLLQDRPYLPFSCSKIIALFDLVQMQETSKTTLARVCRPGHYRSIQGLVQKLFVIWTWSKLIYTCWQVLQCSSEVPMRIHEHAVLWLFDFLLQVNGKTVRTLEDSLWHTGIGSHMGCLKWSW